MRLLRWVTAGFVFAGAAVAATWVLWRSAPQANTTREHFDVILVLGTPSRQDGSVSEGQRQRVLEGVREWRRGRAPRILMSGGAAHNRWVEAHTMALFARQLGVPAADVLEEGRSLNTIQNMCYSYRILEAHGWQSAEVVSEWSHLPRAALILSHLPLEWRTEAAPWPPHSSLLWRSWRDWREAGYYAYLRVRGLPHLRSTDHAVTPRSAQISLPSS